MSETVQVPKGVVDLARRRTEFLISRIVNFDMPLKNALASAYVQGMSDAIDVHIDMQERQISAPGVQS